MVPCIKVNYGFRNHLFFHFIRNDGKMYRSRLIAELRKIIGSRNVLLMPSGSIGLYFLFRSIPALSSWRIWWPPLAVFWMGKGWVFI